MIDLSPHHLATVKCILAKHVPDCEVRAYGSRATWTARDYSDVDLALVGTGPLGPGVVADLKEAFQDSDLPMRVDVLDWHGVSEEFREAIKADTVVLAVREGDRSKWSSLADLAKITMGQSPPGKSVNRVRAGTPLLNGPTEFGPHHPEPVQYTTDVRRLAHAGDILFCVRGATTGRMNWADRDYAIGRGIAAIRHHGDSSLQPFIRAVIEFELPELLARATGSTFPNVSKQQLGSVRCPGFEESEQRAIAHILGTLDEKIELNRRMNETLEAMARALFKSWFVDFDPVRAKMEGRDTGLPKHIADLFPGRLVDSEMGKIPEGWEVKPLDAIAHFQNGLALQKYRPSKGQARLPVVKIAQLRTGRANSKEWARDDIKPECILNNGDVVFSWSGSLLVHIWCGGTAALNQHLFKVTSNKFPKWFYLHCVLVHLSNFQQIAQDKATTMGHIKRKHLNDALCAVAPGSAIISMSHIFNLLLRRQITNELESRTLTTLRDTLLPKLILGDIRLPKAGMGMEVQA